MKHYIATEAVIPLRSAPRESAEMVSQILFGERLTSSQQEGNWLYVKNEEDGYEGWLTTYMVTEISPEQGQIEMNKLFVTEQAYFLEENNGSKLYLPLGARIPVGNGWGENGKLNLGQRVWDITNRGLSRAQSDNNLLRIAQTFLNAPYLWGGRSSFGVDCSGLTQVAYRMCGLFLPRDSGQQWKKGELISWESRQAGDLAFFTKKDATKISHVGLLMEDKQIIHASGRVRIDNLAEEGIVQKGSKELTHYLVGIKRYL